MFQFLKKLLFGKGIDLKPLLHERKALILDVRTVPEFRMGHAKGSVNIPLQELGSRMGELKKKNVPIVACCRSGARSGTATRMLQGAGMEAYNGGSWQNVARQL
jgi:phage shock protein E